MKMSPIKFSQNFKEGDKSIRCELEFHSGGRTVTLNVYDTFDDCKKIYGIAVFTNSSADEGSIQPTVEQRQLIDAISRGDIRGDYAETIVYTLFVDLFVLNPKAELGKFLPHLVEWTTKTYVQYGWPRQSR